MKLFYLFRYTFQNVRPVTKTLNVLRIYFNNFIVINIIISGRWNKKKSWNQSCLRNSNIASAIFSRPPPSFKLPGERNSRNLGPTPPNSAANFSKPQSTEHSRGEANKNVSLRSGSGGSPQDSRLLCKSNCRHDREQRRETRRKVCKREGNIQGGDLAGSSRGNGHNRSAKMGLLVKGRCKDGCCKTTCLRFFFFFFFSFFFPFFLPHSRPLPLFYVFFPPSGRSSRVFPASPPSFVSSIADSSHASAVSSD